MGIELYIENEGRLYAPLVEEGITWKTERKGTPGILEFSVLKDPSLDFQEGNPVRFSYEEQPVFFGYAFSKGRDKSQQIKVTAYDQLRYLKNKDTYVYTNKTASELVAMIAEDFQLQIGEIEDTVWKIPLRSEPDTTLFDIIGYALDETIKNSVKMYVLYDDFGKLTLKNVESMKLDLLVNDEAAENFEYKTTIDGQTYNKIKLLHENEESGKRDVYITQDSGNINKWGVLQYFESIDDNVNGQAKAEALLKLHNKKARQLTVKNVFGDIRARAGASVVVALNLGDIVVQSYMMIERAVHTFKKDEYSMDLTLRGGEFIG